MAFVTLGVHSECIRRVLALGLHSVCIGLSLGPFGICAGVPRDRSARLTERSGTVTPASPSLLASSKVRLASSQSELRWTLRCAPFAYYRYPGLRGAPEAVWEAPGAAGVAPRSCLGSAPEHPLTHPGYIPGRGGATKKQSKESRLPGRRTRIHIDTRRHGH